MQYLLNLIKTGGEKLQNFVDELTNMPRLTQLQLRLTKQDLLKVAKKGSKIENLKDTWVTLDNVFVEELKDAQNRFIGYKLLANETKLSKLSTLTPNQRAFKKLLESGKVDFNIRSVRPAVTDVFKDSKKVTIGKWIQTTGKGVESATELTTKTLF